MNKTVVLMGMHRSGSSATMGFLRILGVDIGDNIGGQNAFNPKGYLENQDFFRFEQKILRNSGGDWQTIVPEAKLYKTFKMYAKEYNLLVNQYNRSPLWGYKAIRGGLFPEILTRLPNLYLVITLRSPLCIADSLKRRNGFPLNKSLWLWSSYYNRIWRFISRHPDIPFIVINYDDLVDHPKETIEALARFLDVKMTSKIKKEAEDWVEKTYRHHKE